MSDLVDYVLYDLLSPLDGLSSKKLFGGVGLYRHGVIFAIIYGGELYFKVDKNNLSEFEKLGGRFFVYSKKDKKIKLPYFSVPLDVVEDIEEAVRLANLSYETTAKNGGN